MKKIVKTPEPREWRDFRRTPGATYEAMPELRDSLLEEQGYICAYCMQRLPKDEIRTTTRIEHIKCRDNYPELQLDYKNMVVCCSGESNSFRHCDVHKENLEISFDLFSDRFFQTLSYKIGSGIIQSSNEKWDLELNNVLNLNNSTLKSNRKCALDAMGVILGAKENWPSNKLTKLRNEWDEKDNEGTYQPFSGMVIWFLDRMINNRRNHKL